MRHAQSDTAKPGRLGADLTAVFHDAGYPVIAGDQPAGTTPGIIEVYPHPALLKLLQANYCVPYKAGKSRKYWPEIDHRGRISRLLQMYNEILKSLSAEISSIDIPLPSSAECRTLSSLKPFEDSLDALVCAWIGCQYIEGHAKPFGDENAAVWIPL